MHVGIAWFDEQPPPMDEVTLRTGGLPLMGQDVAWPACSRLGRPMLFRAQLPLPISGLVGFDDERVVLVFECHADHDGQACTEGVALISSGPVHPRRPPLQWRPAGSLGPPTIIEPRGGKLVPFDDELPGAHRTTLPPLESLAEAPLQGRLLGLLGGATPGSRDASTFCDCGRPTRTVLRLMALEPSPEPHVTLGPALVQACLRCNRAWVHRMVLPRS